MMSTSESYIYAAITGEASRFANAPISARNNELYRSALRLGRIPDTPMNLATEALMKAAEENGYLRDHSRSATLDTLERGFRTGQRLQRKVTPLFGAQEPER